jgi:hypothetical protein
MNYEILYDTTTVSFSYGKSVALIVPGVLSIVFAAFAMIRFAEGRTTFLRAFKGLAVGIVGFGMFYLVGADWWNYQKLQAAAASDTGISHVEGVVQDHWVKEQTSDTGGEIKIETVEHFRIRHTHFQFIHGAGKGHYFTNSGDSAVDLREGMRLRIAYLEDGESNLIVKLEMKK